MPQHKVSQRHPGTWFSLIMGQNMYCKTGHFLRLGWIILPKENSIFPQKCLSDSISNFEGLCLTTFQNWKSWPLHIAIHQMCGAMTADRIWTLNYFCHFSCNPVHHYECLRGKIDQKCAPLFPFKHLSHLAPLSAGRLFIPSPCVAFQEHNEHNYLKTCCTDRSNELVCFMHNLALRQHPDACSPRARTLSTH